MLTFTNYYLVSLISKVREIRRWMGYQFRFIIVFQIWLWKRDPVNYLIAITAKIATGHVWDQTGLHTLSSYCILEMHWKEVPTRSRAASLPHTDPATPITWLLSPTAFKVRLNTSPSKGNRLSPYPLPSPEHYPYTKSLISSHQG